MSYTDGGSMKGSGIDSSEREWSSTCDNIDCIFDGDVTAEVDDFGTLRWTCPKCGHTHEVEEPDN
jgi:rubrerythrin